MVKKLVRDGQVAVIYSRGFGAGWSSWNREWAEQLTFDEELALAVERGDMDGAERRARELVGPDNGYFGGLHGLCIEWIPVGHRFRIHEYDGAESVVTLGQEELSWTA